MTNIKISYRLHLLFILFFPIFTYILASIIQPQILNAENKINIIEESVKTEFPQGIRYKLEIDSANRIEEVIVRFRIVIDIHILNLCICSFIR